MIDQKIADLRQEYNRDGLTEDAIADCPFKQFAAWFADAQQAGIVEPNAMTLATVNADGSPAARVVLLKSFDSEGFVFFTNYQSDKGQQLAADPRAALVFWWDKLERSVRIEGRVEKVSRSDSEAYFSSRPRGSQLGAVASPQSEVVANRDALELRLQRSTEQYSDHAVACPEHWGGYLLVPRSVEFWVGRRSRLHDRLKYRRQPSGDWILSRLAP